jgi:hypothetical protein
MTLGGLSWNLASFYVLRLNPLIILVRASMVGAALDLIGTLMLRIEEDRPLKAGERLWPQIELAWACAS